MILGSALLWNNYIGLFVVFSISVVGLSATVLALLFGPKIYILFFTKDGRECNHDKK